MEAIAIERRRHDEPYKTKVQLRTLSDLDYRTKAAQRARQLVNEIEAEYGPDLTVVQKQLAFNSALLAAMIEDQACRWLEGETIDQLVFAQLVSTQRRALGSL
jgi:hypothetical protein